MRSWEASDHLCFQHLFNLLSGMASVFFTSFNFPAGAGAVFFQLCLVFVLSDMNGAPTVVI